MQGPTGDHELKHQPDNLPMAIQAPTWPTPEGADAAPQNSWFGFPREASDGPAHLLAAGHTVPASPWVKCSPAVQSTVARKGAILPPRGRFRHGSQHSLANTAT